MLVKILDTNGNRHMGILNGINQTNEGFEISLSNGYEAFANENETNIDDMIIISKGQTYVWEIKTGSKVNGQVCYTPFGPDTSSIKYPQRLIKWVQVFYFISNLWEKEV